LRPVEVALANAHALAEAGAGPHSSEVPLIDPIADGTVADPEPCRGPLGGETALHRPSHARAIDDEHAASLKLRRISRARRSLSHRRC
jgi:hypothetical protein